MTTCRCRLRSRRCVLYRLLFLLHASYTLGFRGDVMLMSAAKRPKDSEASLSSFGATSGLVKAIVGGLTDIFVGFSGGGDVKVSSSPVVKAALSLEELQAGVRGEYANNYLWTGDINENLYEEDCTFTDPTLSFSGLTTYKRNIASLQGILDALVFDSQSVLYTCELCEVRELEDSCVRTRWRMLGYLRLPWSPCIDVIGQTAFSYDRDRGNRIVSYDEIWEVEPTQALLQLLRGARRMPTVEGGEGARRAEEGEGAPTFPED
ncbi:unnamed protein product [Discosporangium mesarthrocarpum]